MRWAVESIRQERSGLQHVFFGDRAGRGRVAGFEGVEQLVVLVERMFLVLGEDVQEVGRHHPGGNSGGQLP